LRNLYRTVYLKDIYERYNIERKAEFEELVRTIETYIGYLENAFMIEKAERHDIKGKKHIGSTPKYYFKDLGLRNAKMWPKYIGTRDCGER